MQYQLFYFDYKQEMHFLWPQRTRVEFCRWKWCWCRSCCHVAGESITICDNSLKKKWVTLNLHLISVQTVSIHWLRILYLLLEERGRGIDYFNVPKVSGCVCSVVVVLIVYFFIFWDSVVWKCLTTTWCLLEFRALRELVLLERQTTIIGR